ncbi:MAG: ATP-binding cassette domain-containing protein [Gemmatimonadales bacterium]
MPPPAPALELAGVSRRYRAGVPGCAAEVAALDGVTLSVAHGECVGIAGVAGAGKTTLLLCAAGLLPPESGSVRGVRAAFVSAHGGAHPFLSIRASLDFAGTMRELAGNDEPPDVEGVIARAGLAEVAGFRVGQLGAGMRAQATLAHALLEVPGLLCLDDPLGALDGAERLRYAGLLDALRADGLAVLVASRDAAPLEAIGARVITLDAGRIVARTRPERTLELDVRMPRQAATALSDRIPSVHRSGRALRVPLERISAEEVLSACLSLGISVSGSRVITSTAGGRVAEKLPPTGPIP